MKVFAIALVAFLAFVCPAANAENPWRYPKLGPGVSGETQIDSQSVAKSWGCDIDDSFDTVVNWYAKKLNASGLTKALEKYANRDEDAPDISHGSIDAVTLSPASEPSKTTSIIYFLTPSHKHVTILHPISTGDVVVLSIAGTSSRTSVQFVEKKTTR